MAITNAAERYKYYSQKTKSWPEEAEFYLGSNSLGVNLERLADLYRLKPADISEMLIDFILIDCDFAQLEDLCKDRLNLDKDAIKNFCDDFIIYILLPLDSHYPELKIKAEAEKRKINLAKYESFAIAFDQELEGEIMDAVDGLVERIGEADAKEESDAVLGVIKNSLADLLKNGTRDSIESLNNSLLFVFNDDIKNRDKVLQLLTTDKSKLTEKSLLIHDKPEEPTIANWLADFLFRAQNKIADSLVLTEYMTGSVNCRRLDAKERLAVQNLFTFYRNLKLYPEIFNNVELKDWQIFPMPEEDEKKPAQKAERSGMKPAPVSEGSVAESAAVKGGSAADKLKQYDWSAISGLERRAILEELGISKQDFDEYMKTVK